MKFLIWLVVAVVAGLWWSSQRRRRAEAAAPPPPAPGPAPQLTMRQCAHCGVHLPEADAVTRAGLAYCSGAHADAGPRPPHA